MHSVTLMHSACASCRPFPVGPGRILKSKGSPLCLKKPIKFSPRNSSATLRHHAQHSQIMLSTRNSSANYQQIACKSFANHLQMIRKSSANHLQIIRKSFGNGSRIIRKSSAIQEHTAIRITTTTPISHTTPSSAAACAKHAEFGG